MSTFSYRRAMKRIAEREVIEEVEQEVIEEQEVGLHICEICGKEYKTERGLKKHIETKHKDGE